jgi:ABC-type transport system involved in multi-copper enzyme maturation permease subunit
VPDVLMADVYRLGKSKLLYGIAVFTSVLAFFLVLVIRQDVRFGISVFGDLIAFKEIADVIRIGTAYQKGLGILASVLISVFIGQEYEWKTWQHKWVANKSRSSIYLSKVMLSSIISVVIFLLFQWVVLLSSGQIFELLNAEYAVLMTGSIFIYAALGSVICLLAMLIKNRTASTIVCLGYVLMCETFISVLKNITGFSDMAARLVGWCIQHSIYGMSSLVMGTTGSTDFIVPILINAVVIIFLSTAVGLFVFNKVEF